MSTADASRAQTVGDLGRELIISDGDLEVCNLKKDAIVEIAESGNRRWWQILR